MNTALKDNDQDVIEGVVIEDLPNLKEKAAKQKKTKFKPVDVRNRRERVLAIIGKYLGYIQGYAILGGGVLIAGLAILGSYAGVPLFIGGLTWALLSLLGAGVVIGPGLYLMAIGSILTGISTLMKALVS